MHINCDKLKKMVEDRWEKNGFKKLEKPLDTESLYIAVRIADDCDDKEFDFMIWEPAMLSLEKVIVEEGSQYYRVDVTYEDKILVIISTCGE